jgi:hypothetical protein
MSLSFCMSNYNSILYLSSMLMSFVLFSMSSLFHMCNDGLEVRLVVSQQREHRFESMLEQFLLKTKAVNSVHGNRNMARKILTWWENSVRGNRKTARKNSGMVGNFPQWEKNVFMVVLHGAFSTVPPFVKAGIYLPLLYQRDQRKNRLL